MTELRRQARLGRTSGNPIAGTCDYWYIQMHLKGANDAPVRTGEPLGEYQRVALRGRNCRLPPRSTDTLLFFTVLSTTKT